MVIREANPADAKVLSELAIETYVTAFGHSFSPSDLAAHLEKNHSPNRFAQILGEDTVLIAEVQERMVGYAQFGKAHVFGEPVSDNLWEVRRLYVHADFQNQGIGARLMDAALAHPSLRDAKRILLDVWEHNHSAQRFYARYGFEVIGKRAFGVESGAETSFDLLMVRCQPQ